MLKLEGGRQKDGSRTVQDDTSNADGGTLGRLEVQLISGPEGCRARFAGDLIEGTRAAVWGVEQILLHDARVVVDLSGITSFDSLGLEAALGLMDAVRSFGGKLTIGDEVGIGGSIRLKASFL
jgi:hypothetical protein